MRTLRFTNTCELDLDQMATGHYWNLRIVPHDDPSQKILLGELRVRPNVPESRQTDGFGNVLLVGGCAQEHNEFGYLVSGVALMDASKGRGTYLNPVYSFSSTLTRPGAKLTGFYQGLVREHGAHGSSMGPREAAERAQLFSSAVHKAMDYVPGSTNVLTTAEEAFEQHQGVCQDYAHVLLALLRMDRIPARYVGGLMLGEGATHAWVEFYDGGNWWGIDPTNDCEAGENYIVLVRGRDHYDCPMERGVLRSSAMQHMTTHVKVEELPQEARA